MVEKTDIDMEKERVRELFSTHAFEYDEWTDVQKRVIGHFLAFLKVTPPPRRILDIGAGTGMLALRLRQLFPAAEIVCLDLAPGMIEVARQNLSGAGQVEFINGDAESLPVGDGSFDLVVSTSTYQWLGELDKAFSEVHRVLIPGGTFAFSLFGEKTLYELRHSYCLAAEGAAGMANRTRSFFSCTEVAAALETASFSGIHTRTQMEEELHADPLSLLHALKRVGASRAASILPNGLGARKIMMAMAHIYKEKFGRVGGIPATYEVIYGEGKRLG